MFILHIYIIPPFSQRCKSFYQLCDKKWIVYETQNLLFKKAGFGNFEKNFLGNYYGQTIMVDDAAQAVPAPRFGLASSN